MTQKLRTIITHSKDVIFFIHDGLMSSFMGMDEVKFEIYNMRDFLSPLVEEIGIEERDN